MEWQFEDRTSVYLQIVSYLRNDILNGKYPPGSQLPPVRTLAVEAGVNPNTMQRAMIQLESEKLFETRGTLGRFVTTDIRIIEDAKSKEINRVLTKIITEAEKIGISVESLAEYLKNYNKELNE